jgi:hypothetical protein
MLNLQKTKWIFASLILLGLMLIYALYDPADSPIFPKCPFRSLTGYKCPGCGSQRAIHDLLHLDIAAAFRENFMLMLAIPYMITGAVFDLIKKPGPRLISWRKILFGTKAIFIVLFLIIAFWILRNIYGF